MKHVCCLESDKRKASEWLVKLKAIWFKEAEHRRENRSDTWRVGRWDACRAGQTCHTNDQDSAAGRAWRWDVQSDCRSHFHLVRRSRSCVSVYALGIPRALVGRSSSFNHWMISTTSGIFAGRFAEISNAVFKRTSAAFAWAESAACRRQRIPDFSTRSPGLAI